MLSSIFVVAVLVRLIKILLSLEVADIAQTVSLSRVLHLNRPYVIFNERWAPTD